MGRTLGIWAAVMAFGFLFAASWANWGIAGALACLLGAGALMALADGIKRRRGEEHVECEEAEDL